MSHEVEEFLQLWDVYHRVSSAYQPTSGLRLCWIQFIIHYMSNNTRLSANIIIFKMTDIGLVFTSFILSLVGSLFELSTEVDMDLLSPL